MNLPRRPRRPAARRIPRSCSAGRRHSSRGSPQIARGSTALALNSIRVARVSSICCTSRFSSSRTSLCQRRSSGARPCVTRTLAVSSRRGSMVTDCGDELDALPVWQSIGHEPAPGHQPGTRRRHKTVRCLKRRRNKERVMDAPSNPNASEPARRLDLVGLLVPLVVDDGGRHPSTELGLIADQAPHAERHAQSADECLVHSLSRLAFCDTTSTGGPSGRESGVMSKGGGAQVCNCAV